MGKKMWILTMVLSALAVTPQALEARLQEIAPLRTKRLADVPLISPEDYRSAALGKVPTGMRSVAGYSFKKGYGVRVVALPIEQVWAAVNDDKGKLKHTKLGYAEILQGRPCESGRVVFQYLPLPMVSDRWWVSSFQATTTLNNLSAGRVREMRWTSVDGEGLLSDMAKSWAKRGIPVNFNVGAWFLVDLGGGSTLIEYYAWSDPAGYIPASLTNSMAKGGIENTIDAVRKVAEAGSQCPLN
jgi:uncharacterized protein YndB with AHSA1/START domain